MPLHTITPVVFFLPRRFPTQSESTCTWKSSCINSMGSSFLWPVMTRQILVNSALAANVLALDRHCSATMIAVFLHCTAVLNCVRATHGLPADRAPVYRGRACRDPLGCPLIPRQDGIRDKAPTLWLLQLLRLLQLLHAYAFDQHWTCFHKQKKKKEKKKKKKEK